MSITFGSYISCPKLQGQMNDYLNICPVEELIEDVGTIMWLTSPNNTQNVLQKALSPGNGKKRDVEIIYQPRYLLSDVGTARTTSCTSSNKAGELSYTYSAPTKQVSVNEYIDISQLETMCMDNQYYFQKRILAMMNGAIRKMNQVLAQKLTTMYGTFANGDKNGDATGTAISGNIKSIVTKQATALGSYPDTTGLEEIDFSVGLAGYCQRPVILGYGEIYKYLKRLQSGCCANSGLDIGDIAAREGFALVQDRDVWRALSATEGFLTLAPGAAQMIWFNLYDGPRGINMVDTEILKRTVLRHPIYGIPFDFKLVHDCNGVISFFLELDYDVVASPADMFYDGDYLDGVNFINRYKVVNPA